MAGEQPDELVAAFRAAAPEALLAIGPLTNVAGAGVARRGRCRRSRSWAARSAPVRHRGRLQRVEHNFAADPAAAALVVARTDATIVPLDVTARCGSTDDQVDDARARARLVPRSRGGTRSTTSPVVLHDPLALLVVRRRPVVTIERRVAVRRRADGTRREARGRPGQHAVVVGVDAPAAVDRVLGLLG